MRPYARTVAAHILAIALAFFCATRAQSQAAQPAPSSFHEDPLAEIFPGAEVKQVLASGHRLAWVEKQGGKHTVRLDGKQQGDAYDEIKSLAFSSDESHFAFFGKRSSEWIFVLDGQPRSNGYSTATDAAFQPAGPGMAYGECREKKCRLVVDGSETGAEYEDVSFPLYSPDGKRIAYVAKRSKKWVAVVDGKELGPEFDQIWFSSWGFSPGGGRFFVTGRVKGDFLHAVDGVATPGFEVLSRIAFSRDEKHYAYSGANSKGGLKKQTISGTVVKDGQPVATYEGKGMMGKWSLVGGTEQVMLGGVRTLTTDFHGVSAPEFDPEGKLVYAARRDKGDVAVFQGTDAGPGFDEILSKVVFTPDAQHFAYVARLNGDFVEVRDNKVVRTIPAGKRGATEVGRIAISSDGSHLGYETISGGRNFKAGETPRAYRTAIVDGQSGPEYNALGMVDFAFDPDAHHYFYEVIGADDKRDLVDVDGHDSRLYDLATNLHYLADSKKIEFVARDGSHLLRVTYTPPPGPGAP